MLWVFFKFLNRFFCSIGGSRVTQGSQSVRLTSAYLHNIQRAFHHLYSICSLFKGTCQGTHAWPAADSAGFTCCIFSFPNSFASLVKANLRKPPALRLLACCALLYFSSSEFWYFITNSLYFACNICVSSLISV